MENKISTSQRIISYLNVLLRIVLIVLVVILLHAIYKGLQQDGYIIQPIQTPKSFTDSGYSGVVVASKLQDKVKEIKSNANSTRQDSLQIKATNNSDLKMDVMGIGVSSTSLIYHIKDLLRIESKTIQGDITDLDNELSMTIRVYNFPVKTFTETYELEGSSKALVKLITRVAEYILSCTDPYYQVINLYRNEKYEEAHELIREMIINRPGEEKWAYLAWGNMSRKQGFDHKASGYFLKALEIDDDFFLANKNLAWRYYSDEEFEMAISYFEKALNTRPNDYESINAIGMCYESLGNHPKTEDYFKLNVERNPGVIWSYMQYADFYTTVRKDTVMAINIFNKAKDNVTQNDDYYLTLAGYYYFQNKLDSALLFLDKSLDFNPNNISGLQQIIGYLTSTEVGKHSESIEFQKRLVKIQDNGNFGKWTRISTYNRLAMSEWRIAEYDSAFVHVNMAINLEPTYPIPYTTLAEIYFAKNDRKSFYRIMQKSFDLGLKFENDWFKDEPYKSLATDQIFLKMLEGSVYRVKQNLKD